MSKFPLLVAIVAVLGGCTVSEPATGQSVTEVRAGEVAKYVALDPTQPVRQVTLTAALAAVLDSGGRQIEAVHIQKELVVAVKGERYPATSSDFLDAEHRPFLVFTPCKAHGLGLSPERCHDGRISASYMEEGTFGLLGGAPFVGKSAERPVVVPLALFGQVQLLAYIGAPSPGDGPGCTSWQTNQSVPSLGDQRFFWLATVPQKVTICPDSAFPVEVHAAEFSFRRESLVPGGEPLRSSAVAARAFGAPSPAVRPAVAPSSLSSYSPTGFALREALAYVLNVDDEGRQLARGAHNFVGGDTFGKTRVTYEDLTLSYESEATVSIRDSSGRGIQKTLRKSCTAIHCEITTAPTAYLPAEPSMTTVTIPQERLFETANATFGGPWDFYAAVSRFETPRGDVFTTGGRLIHVFRQNPQTSTSSTTLGVPHTVYVDGSTGTVLAFDLPERFGKARIMPAS